MAIWLDLEGLEDYLKIPKSTLYRLVQQGRLPGYKIGRTWRFDQDEIDGWIRTKGSKPGSVRPRRGQSVIKKRHQAVLREGIHSSDPVSGLTHNFYRYPARFSPLFTRAVIETFTQPGDVVYDPFMGGATSIVEASALGRRAVGTDINSLALFLADVKTTVLNDEQISSVRGWAKRLVCKLNVWRETPRADEWADSGYQRNINGKETWRIRKLLEIALADIEIRGRLKNSGLPDALH